MAKKFAVLHTSNERWHVRPCKVMDTDGDTLEVRVDGKPAEVLNGYRSICMKGGNTMMASVDVCDTREEAEEKRADKRTHDVR